MDCSRDHKNLKTAPHLIKRRASGGYEGPKLAVDLEDLGLWPIFNICKKYEDVNGSLLSDSAWLLSGSSPGRRAAGSRPMTSKQVWRIR